MVATASIKMDELLATWMGSETIYENVMRIIESQKAETSRAVSPTNTTKDVIDANDNDNDATATPGGGGGQAPQQRPPLSPKMGNSNSTTNNEEKQKKPRIEIPPFFRSRSKEERDHDSNATTELQDNPQNPPPAPPKRRRDSSFADDQTWDGIYMTNREGGGGDYAKQDANNNNDAKNNNTTIEFDRDSIATDGSLGTAIHTAHAKKPCIALQAKQLFYELGIPGNQPPPPQPQQQQQQQSSTSNPLANNVPAILSRYLRSPSETYHRTEDDCRYIPVERFQQIAKELCNLPTFFHKPLYERILRLWETHLQTTSTLASSSTGPLPTSPGVVTYGIFHYFWNTEMAPYDMNERFFRLLKQPNKEYIARDDFFPYIKELLSDHPGLEFLSNHAEFQDKYAVTVITRIFYSVNLCHSGRITSRQIRKSNLLSVFQQVDEEEDINKVTKYFSYEHFYVLYCRFWELDHDRDYRITREDLLKYGEHSLSHMIVDRIFDAAPRPFEGGTTDAGGGGAGATTGADGEGGGGGGAKQSTSRDYLTYEDFIFFMLSEEDKANEFSVRYWFACVDVDGDDKLNNMEMRSFYAVQLHRMQCMGHEVVPFEDMLCQMMDMIKPANTEHLVVEDFLQTHCSQVSGALFDALFNVNKYVMFEQRDPFLERQKREDEFDTDWDRFACIDYNRLAMEEEQREEEALEVDWVTMDEEEEDGDEYNAMSLSGSSEAPF